MNKVSRIILHIDMNCFFASCEIAENEELRGKPIVVAHNDSLDRGLITSPSYEARALGIRTTMHVNEAKRICPTVIVVTPTPGIYNYYSQKFYEYLLNITDQVQMASCDEAYVDVSALNLGKEVIELAHKIQNDLLKMYKLPCSIGIAPNKLLAKMGSDYKKPLGITVFRKRDVATMLWPLPIENMMYIGKKTAPRLKEIGINTIGDLANYKDIELLRRRFGDAFVNSMIPSCYGVDDTPVVTESSVASSVSCAHTFMNEVFDYKLLIDTFKMVVNSVCYRLQESRQMACNIGIQIHYTNYENFSKSKSLIKPSSDEFILFSNVKDIFDDFYNEGKAIRLIGVFSNRLIDKKDEPKQISIFDNFTEIEKKQKINNLIDEINNSYGKNTVKKGI